MQTCSSSKTASKNYRFCEEGISSLLWSQPREPG